MKVTPGAQILTKAEAQQKGAMILGRLAEIGHDATTNGWFLTELRQRTRVPADKVLQMLGDASVMAIFLPQFEGLRSKR